MGRPRWGRIKLPKALIADLYAGNLHPRVAAGLAPLMNVQLRAIETTNLEQRLTKMESKLQKLLAEMEAWKGPDGKPWGPGVHPWGGKA